MVSYVQRRNGSVAAGLVLVVFSAVEIWRGVGHDNGFLVGEGIKIQRPLPET